VNAALLFHTDNSRRLFQAAEGELGLVALFLAQELFAQRRLRRDDEDFLFVVDDFRAAGARADEVNGAFAAVFQFHQRTDVNDLAGVKFPDGQLFKFSDGGFDFRRLFGLAAGEVGGFESAGVVFALSLVLLVRGFGARGVRGAEIDGQFVRQPADDFFNEGAFVHHDCTAVVPIGSAMIGVDCISRLPFRPAWFWNSFAIMLRPPSPRGEGVRGFVCRRLKDSLAFAAARIPTKSANHWAARLTIFWVNRTKMKRERVSGKNHDGNLNSKQPTRYCLRLPGWVVFLDV